MLNWLWKRKATQLPPIPRLGTNHEIGCKLLDLFRTYDAGQQVCLYCEARGGFEMNHNPNCILDLAASRLFMSQDAHVQPRP